MTTLQHIDDKAVVFTKGAMDLNQLKYEALKEYHGLNDYIEDRFDRKKSNYVFIDEVQMCEQFELAINSLHSTGR